MSEFFDQIDPFEYGDDFGETMISGWTDEEIEAYDAYLAECDKYDDPIPAYVGPISEPPF